MLALVYSMRKKMKMKLMTGVATLAMALVAPMAFGQILNGSFEAGTGADADSWTRFGNAFREANTPNGSFARTGTHSMKQFGNFSGGFNVTGAFQNFAISTGETVSASVWAQTLLADRMSGGNSALLKLVYFDANNAEVAFAESNFIDATTTPDTYIELTASLGPAASNVAYGQLLLLHLQPAVAGGSVFFDDVSLDVEAVPEPATMAVLGLAAAAALRKRRQK